MRRRIRLLIKQSIEEILGISVLDVPTLRVSAYDFNRIRTGSTLIFHKKTVTWLKVFNKWKRNEITHVKFVSVRENKYAYCSIAEMLSADNIIIRIDHIKKLKI